MTSWLSRRTESRSGVAALHDAKPVTRWMPRAVTHSTRTGRSSMRSIPSGTLVASASTMACSSSASTTAGSSPAMATWTVT